MGDYMETMSASAEAGAMVGLKQPVAILTQDSRGIDKGDMGNVFILNRMGEDGEE